MAMAMAGTSYRCLVYIFIRWGWGGVGGGRVGADVGIGLQKRMMLSVSVCSLSVSLVPPFGEWKWHGMASLRSSSSLKTRARQPTTSDFNLRPHSLLSVCPRKRKRRRLRQKQRPQPRLPNNKLHTHGLSSQMLQHATTQKCSFGLGLGRC